ncbi:hypothetical protein [Telmatospirillum sp.]|uniref:hypothetical protein n=1 Tax=Telmatospirillum sp. TaxID=2079197 RepID=UPI00284D420E|nr:hypothetical protein [Telmatospirillum sp.]MDR3439891.1 hypothetical protein [Telmatospirillum sp.]
MSRFITLQFCSFDSFWGKAIPWFTQGDVGHVDAVLPDGSLLGAQHEAGLGGPDVPAGVQIRPANYGDTSGMTGRIRVPLPATDGQADTFWSFLQAQIGKPYDVTAIEAFIAGRNWHDPDAWFCSELIAAALEHAGVFPYPLSSPANRVTPASLLLVCSALAETVPA